MPDTSTSGAAMHDDPDPTTLLAQAEMLFNAGKYELAKALLLRAGETTLSDPKLQRLLGFLFLQEEDYGNACAALDKAAMLDDPRVLAGLGVCRRQLGHPVRAISAFRRAVELRPDDIHSLHHLGVLHVQCGEWPMAIECFSRVAADTRPEAAPLVMDSLEMLADTCLLAGDPDQSLQWAIDLARRFPDSPSGCVKACEALIRMDKPDAALPHCREAARRDPDSLSCLARFGDALQMLGRHTDAINEYARALEIDPRNLDVRSNLGAALKAQGRYAEAKDMFAACLALDPRHISSLVNLGILAKEGGDAPEAQSLFLRAVKLHPRNLSLRLYLCMSRLPFLYMSEEEIDTARRDYGRDLEELDRMSAEADLGDLRDLAQAVGALQPYYLPYQGRNDRELQAIYGRVALRAIQSAYGRLAPDAMPAPPAPGERIRVGFVSGFFRSHSVWKLPTRGWVEGLDRERFEIFGYSVSQSQDEETVAIGRRFDHFKAGLATLPLLAQAVAGDRPHILIYPEVGMDPVCAKSACLRLAPVQCASWGHPDTTGLDTVDHYLSSRSMEPENARDHYHEDLVLLDGHSTPYVPTAPHPSAEPRQAFGLKEDDVVYLCLQSLYKYLPAQDRVLAAIAREVPGSRFVFLLLSGAVSSNIAFRQRIGRAFRDEGLDPAGRLVFLPRMPLDRFHALAAHGDAFLDSFGWSGCNTSLETMLHSVPGVTLPGEFMRGRHTMAFFRTMGLTELIAGSEREYLDIAVRLGTDPAWRKRLSDRIRETLHLNYQGTEALRSLERFLEQAAGRS